MCVCASVCVGLDCMCVESALVSLFLRARTVTLTRAPHVSTVGQMASWSIPSETIGMPTTASVHKHTSMHVSTGLACVYRTRMCLQDSHASTVLGLNYARGMHT